MKKTVLTFGLMSGAVSAALMLATLPFVDALGFDKGEIVGYTAIVLSFLLVFFGIRSYRQHVGAGRMTFGRGFGVGILITLITCAFYVATWEVIYFKLKPGFGEKYAGYMVAQAKASGASQEAIDASVREAQSFKAMYDKPLVNAAITFTEPFPVGLAMTVISAAVLRRK
jgi:uncharacterized protein DUF4199